MGLASMFIEIMIGAYFLITTSQEYSNVLLFRTKYFLAAQSSVQQEQQYIRRVIFSALIAIISLISLQSFQTMKKGGKQGSKKTKQRRHIQIKQSRQISPVKQVTEPEESRLLFINQRNSQMLLGPLPSKACQFTNQQIQSLSSHADALLSVEIMKSIITKEDKALHEFYATSPSIVKTAFQKAISNSFASMNVIREERIERMKEQTVLFIPPDKDNFEKQKGRILDNWIKQQMEVHQQRRNFKEITDSQAEIFRETERKISQLAIDVPKQKIEPCLQKISKEVEDKNRVEIDGKMNQLKSQLRQICEVVDDMRKLKEKKMEQQRRAQWKKQMSYQNYLMQRHPTHSMALFSIQDYFY